jgi:hypothetical protein
MTTYKTCLEISNRKHEKNDCGVTAIAIATGIGYDKAHKVLSSVGRKPRRGISFNMLKDAIEAVTGKRPTFETILKPNGSRYTGVTIGKALPKGKYVLLFGGHAAALVDGVIEDWTDGRRKRILGYFKV